MAIVSDNAFQAWLSLYTKEIETIWEVERKELRQAAIIFHVLKQEFNRVEDDLNAEIVKLRQKLEVADDHKQTLQSQSEPNKSPKIKRHRSVARAKRVGSPSLLDIQKEKRSKVIVPKIQTRKESEDLFDSPITISDTHTVGEEGIIKTTNGCEQVENADLVDSTFIIAQTPDKPITAKKLKLNKILKENYSHKENQQNKTQFTITQMFDYIPHERIGKRHSRIKNEKQALAQCNSDDETLLFDMKTSKQPTVVTKPDFFKDYDKVPVSKSTTPQHVHKTEPVRRKVERMKLPGWSCDECRQYYEGLNLSPEELRKKMNACSKHRNKFPLMNQTPKGFWDVTMAHTQDTDEFVRRKMH